MNFTDTFNHTWESVSELFIIDNIPDEPEAVLIWPRGGEVIDEGVDILAMVRDTENNIHSVGFYYLNESGNWSLIDKTRHVGEYVYATTWDTNQLSNGTYSVKVISEDRNLYMDEDVIMVTVLHGG